MPMMVMSTVLAPLLLRAMQFPFNLNLVPRDNRVVLKFHKSEMAFKCCDNYYNYASRARGPALFASAGIGFGACCESLSDTVGINGMAIVWQSFFDNPMAGDWCSGFNAFQLRRVLLN